MKRKSETFDCFKKFHTFSDKHTGSKLKTVNVTRRSHKSPDRVKAIRTDNGGEYISDVFKEYFQKRGIEHQIKVAYNHQQNGVAERINRIHMDLVRSML